MNQADFCFSSGIKTRLFYLIESARRLNALLGMIVKLAKECNAFVLRYVKA